MKLLKLLTTSIFIVFYGVTIFSNSTFAQTETLLSDTDELPSYLRDRGEGIPSSMFGSYLKKGQFFLYPFFEYYYDKDFEYKPSELGYNNNTDFRGKYLANEGLIFLGYGITDHLMVEFEAAIISAQLDKSSIDPSSMPGRIKESGLGDVEGQLRWRWNRETENRPEFFNYFETVFPLQKSKKLIGTQDWEHKLGFGVVKGFKFGTMTLRFAAEYDGAESKIETGEFALEYLKKLSGHFRLFIGIEGTEDEVESINELQIHVNRRFIIKLNNAFGVTSKATDWAPEIGILLPFNN